MVNEESNGLLGIGSRVRHPAYGFGVVVKLNYASYDVCFEQYGITEVGKEYMKWEVIERLDPDDAITFTEAERSLISILKKWSDVSEVVHLGDKWKGGTLSMQPEDKSLKPKEIPIEQFFHKIVMVRDRIRVMEQRINAHKGLSAEDKVSLQQYITRIYGSLTTFNVLFKLKDQHFKGDSGSK